MLSRMKALVGACLAAIALAGCRSNHDLLPLAVGREWQYRVFVRPQKYVEPLRVVREVSVAGAAGYELESPLGPARIAWKGDALYLSRTINAQYEPALPIFGPNDTKYHGRAIANGKTHPVHGVLMRAPRPEPLTLGGRTFRCEVATLTFEMDGKSIELKTWLSRGVGLIQQEQRVDRVLTVQLQLVTD